MVNWIKNKLTKKAIVLVMITLAVVIVSGGAAIAVLSVVEQKGDTAAYDSKETSKKQAEALNAEAKNLLAETEKLGNTKEGDKKTEEAAAKFLEASKQYEAAGDTAASGTAKADSEMLMYRLAAEEEWKAKQEAEWAKQKAEFEAAGKAMSEAN